MNHIIFNNASGIMLIAGYSYDYTLDPTLILSTLIGSSETYGY
jgi:hypothetical protein